MTQFVFALIAGKRLDRLLVQKQAKAFDQIRWLHFPSHGDLKIVSSLLSLSLEVRRYHL